MGNEDYIPLFNSTLSNNLNDSATGLIPDAFTWLRGFLVGLGAWTWIAIFVLMIVANWIIFLKAGRPGWASLIPIYGTIVYLDIVGRPWWWLFLLLIPIVNIVIVIIITNDLSRAFSYGGWFTVGLLFLPWIFYPILAFGRANYIKQTA